MQVFSTSPSIRAGGNCPAAALILSLFLTAPVAVVQGQASAPYLPLTCIKLTGAPPTIDSNFADWTNEATLSTPIFHAITTERYEDGDMVVRCRYDDNKIYLAMEVPGLFRFNATDNKQCASISTMAKIGKSASFVNMGNCVEALAGCVNGVIPASCDNFRVDLGAHWELRTTQQNTFYGPSGNSTGNDLIANKDDEIGVSPECRPDDNDGANAANEWSGAWSHNNSITGEPGVYRFELSRTLLTNSAKDDIQLAAGGTYPFGLAYWDPYEFATGWMDNGHYVTGGGNSWINLVLVNKAPTKAPTKAPAKAPTKAPTKRPTKAPTKAPISPSAPTTAPTPAPAVDNLQLMFALLVLLYAVLYAMIYGVSPIPSPSSTS
jgi:cell division septation protein DedD